MQISLRLLWKAEHHFLGGSQWGGCRWGRRNFPFFCFFVFFSFHFSSQRALRDRLMSRGKNCLPTVSRQFLTRNYPRPNCLLKCLPNCLSPTREGFLSSFKINPAVRVIARQVRDKNCLAAIFAPRHQSVSSGPLGRGTIFLWFFGHFVDSYWVTGSREGPNLELLRCNGGTKMGTHLRTPGLKTVCTEPFVGNFSAEMCCRDFCRGFSLGDFSAQFFRGAKKNPARKSENEGKGPVFKCPQFARKPRSADGPFAASNKPLWKP